MYCRRDKLECLGNLLFKEFSRIRVVSRVLSGIWTGWGLSNPERCTCGSTHCSWARSRGNRERSRWLCEWWSKRCCAFIIHRVVWWFIMGGGFERKRWTRLVFCHVDLTNLIRIGFGLSSLGREWVTKGFVLRMPPVLFKWINILLVIFWDLIHAIDRRRQMNNGFRRWRSGPEGWWGRRSGAQ